MTNSKGLEVVTNTENANFDNLSYLLSRFRMFPYHLTVSLIGFKQIYLQTNIEHDPYTKRLKVKERQHQ